VRGTRKEKIKYQSPNKTPPKNAKCTKGSPKRRKHKTLDLNLT
jgi:hypothetical protein